MKTPYIINKSFKDGKTFIFTETFIKSVLEFKSGRVVGMGIDRFEEVFLPFDDINVVTNNVTTNIKNVEINQIGIDEGRFVSIISPALQVLQAIRDNYNPQESVQLEKQYNMTDGPEPLEYIEQQMKIALEQAIVQWKLKSRGEIKKLQIFIQAFIPSFKMGIQPFGVTINNDFKYLHNFNFPENTMCIVHPKKNKFIKINLTPIFIIKYMMSTFRPLLMAFIELHNPKRKMFLTRIRQKITQSDNKKKRRIKNSDKYIYLTPTQFMNLDESVSDSINELSEDTSPRATHFRRAHFRTYRNDRYVNMKGKRQYIRPTWVGESCKTINNKQYKVILDIEGYENHHQPKTKHKLEPEPEHA